MTEGREREPAGSVKATCEISGVRWLLQSLQRFKLLLPGNLRYLLILEAGFKSFKVFT